MSTGTDVVMNEKQEQQLKRAWNAIIGVTEVKKI